MSKPDYLADNEPVKSFKIQEPQRKKPGPKKSEIIRKTVGFKFSENEARQIENLQRKLALKQHGITRSDAVLAAVYTALTHMVKNEDKTVKELLACLENMKEAEKI